MTTGKEKTCPPTNSVQQTNVGPVG